MCWSQPSMDRWICTLINSRKDAATDYLRHIDRTKKMYHAYTFVWACEPLCLCFLLLLLALSLSLSMHFVMSKIEQTPLLSWIYRSLNLPVVVQRHKRCYWPMVESSKIGEMWRLPIPQADMCALTKFAEALGYQLPKLSSGAETVVSRGFSLFEGAICIF